MMFLNPTLLLLLLLMLPIAIFLRLREQENQKKSKLIERNILYPQMSLVRTTRLILWGSSYALIVVALARPVWGTEIEIVDTQGLSVMLVLDVSTSMDSQDILPSRLERAKVTMQELIQQLDGNEVGLVLFAGQADVQFPLTTDSRSSTDFLKSVSTKSLATQGTNIADALRLALLSLNAASTDQHVIVLLTDGEAHDGDLVTVLNDTIQMETVIHTIGYGERIGVAIPVQNADGSIIDKTDNEGNQVVSALDESILQTLAAATGGRYQHAGSAGNEVSVLMQAMRENISPSVERSVQSRPIERFDIFIALGMLLLAAEIVLSGTRYQAA